MRRRIEPTVNVCPINVVLNLGNQVVRTPDPTDDFYFEEFEDTQTTKTCKCVAHPDPLYMLFNQERLTRLGTTSASAFIESFMQYKDNGLSELRKQCSDDQLLTMIKSRHLQAPSEILAWSRYMNSNMEEFTAEVKKLQEAQIQQQQNVEPKPE